MFFDRILDRPRKSMDKRRSYNRLVAEIQSMSDREIADIRGDRGEMLRSAHQQIYG